MHASLGASARRKALQGGEDEGDWSHGRRTIKVPPLAVSVPILHDPRLPRGLYLHEQLLLPRGSILTKLHETLAYADPFWGTNNILHRRRHHHHHHHHHQQQHHDAPAQNLSGAAKPCPPIAGLQGRLVVRGAEAGPPQKGLATRPNRWWIRGGSSMHR